MCPGACDHDAMVGCVAKNDVSRRMRPYDLRHAAHLDICRALLARSLARSRARARAVHRLYFFKNYIYILYLRG
jgi:hypothetical protein